MESTHKSFAETREQARIEYEKSPEAEAARIKKEIHRQQIQDQLDKVINSMDTIDFSNLE